jgi:hypothetical protein
MKLVNSISGILGRTRKFIAFAGSIGFVRKKSITTSQRKLQKLKAQIDELSDRLGCIETMTGAAEIELIGPGPFRLPVLTRFKALLTELEDHLVAQFELEDQKLIYATVQYLAAAQLVNGDVSLPLQKLTLDPSTPIDFKPTDAFRLPFFARYEGHFYSGRSIRVLVFLTQDGRKVFFPTSPETYETLLQQFAAALVSYEQSDVSRVGFTVRFPYPVHYPIKDR